MAEVEDKAASEPDKPSKGVKKLWKKVSTGLDKQGVVTRKESIDYGSVDPELCIALFKRPSVKNYSGLKLKLTKCDDSWLEEFFTRGGAQVMFDALGCLGDRTIASLTDAVLMLECVSCFKALMRNTVGLDYLIANPILSRNLILALDTGNVMVKKQIFEMLAAVCLYNADGYSLALSSLEYYKTEKGQRYRFSIIINEMKSAEIIPYVTTCMSFINAVTIATPEFDERVRIRNEFIGLGLLDLLTSLRHHEDEDLYVQISVFDEQKLQDDDSLVTEDGLDLNSHVDVFLALFDQVAARPFASNLLCMLQSLLVMDHETEIADSVWNALEEVVKRAVVATNERDLKELKTFTGRQFGTPNHCCTQTDFSYDSGNGSSCPQCSGNATTAPVPLQLPPLAPGGPPPPPPPPPPGGPGGPPPPPPPPPPPGGPGGPPPPPPPPPGGPGGPPPPPPPPGGPPPPPGAPPPPGGPPPPPGAPPPPGGPPPPPGGAVAPVAQEVFGQAPKVTPKAKMRKLNWNKIPDHKLRRTPSSVWRKVKTVEGINPDYAVEEKLFSQDVLKKAPAAEKKKKASDKIQLFDSKRDLNLNIFLKQFKKPTGEIIAMLEKCDRSGIGVDQLKSLKKLLPDTNEVETLRAFPGDKSKLGNAETFVIQLIGVSSYSLRVDGMILMDEAESVIKDLKPNIQLVKKCTQNLLSNELIPEILNLVLQVGNFMNHGSFAGNAGGFTINTLVKLQDTRANRPRMNLLHFIVEVAENQHPHLLDFPKEVEDVAAACRFTVDSLEGELKQLKASVGKLEKGLEKAGKDIKRQFDEFVKSVESEITLLEEEIKQIHELSKELAEYYCEDPKKFKLEQFLAIFKTFATNFEQAKKDNEQFKKQEEKRKEREKKKAEMDAKRLLEGDKPGFKINAKIPEQEEVCVIDKLMDEIKHGFPLRKHSVPTKSPTKAPAASITSRIQKKLNFKQASGLAAMLLSQAGKSKKPGNIIPEEKSTDNESATAIVNGYKSNGDVTDGHETTIARDDGECVKEEKPNATNESQGNSNVTVPLSNNSEVTNANIAQLNNPSLPLVDTTEQRNTDTIASDSLDTATVPPNTESSLPVDSPTSQPTMNTKVLSAHSGEIASSTDILPFENTITASSTDGSPSEPSLVSNTHSISSASDTIASSANDLATETKTLSTDSANSESNINMPLVNNTAASSSAGMLPSDTANVPSNAGSSSTDSTTCNRDSTTSSSVDQSNVSKSSTDINQSDPCSPIEEIMPDFSSVETHVGARKDDPAVETALEAGEDLDQNSTERKIVSATAKKTASKSKGSSFRKKFSTSKKPDSDSKQSDTENSVDKGEKKDDAKDK